MIPFPLSISSKRLTKLDYSAFVLTSLALGHARNAQDAPFAVSRSVCLALRTLFEAIDLSSLYIDKSFLADSEHEKLTLTRLCIIFLIPPGTSGVLVRATYVPQ